MDHKLQQATPSAQFAKFFCVSEGEAKAALFYIAADLANAGIKRGLAASNVATST